MSGASETLTNLTQAAQDIASSNSSESAFPLLNNTEGWTVGPDGEFDGDPEEPRFAVLVFYCILVNNLSTCCIYQSTSCCTNSSFTLPGSHDRSTEWAILLEKAA